MLTSHLKKLKSNINLHPNCSSLQRYWTVGTCHAIVSLCNHHQAAEIIWIWSLFKSIGMYVYIYITVIPHSPAIRILTATSFPSRFANDHLMHPWIYTSLHPFTGNCWKPRNEWNGVNLVALFLHHSTWIWWLHIVNCHKNIQKLHQDASNTLADLWSGAKDQCWICRPGPPQ